MEHMFKYFPQGLQLFLEVHTPTELATWALCLLLEERSHVRGRTCLHVNCSRGVNKINNNRYLFFSDKLSWYRIDLFLRKGNLKRCFSVCVCERVLAIAKAFQSDQYEIQVIVGCIQTALDAASAEPL